jgi:hypothetical protein
VILNLYDACFCFSCVLIAAILIADDWQQSILRVLLGRGFMACRWAFRWRQHWVFQCLYSDGGFDRAWPDLQEPTATRSDELQLTLL